MANFEPAFQKTMGHEGGYVHDIDDQGGETYRGISRRFHPSWGGWSFIDASKDDDNFPACLNGHDAIDISVSQFYKEHYWDRFQGDQIREQDIGEEIFDTGVNMGVHRAVMFLQMALNVLNRNERSWSDIVEDGLLGRGTLHVLEAYRIIEDDSGLLLKVMNTLQGNHYINYLQKSPTQEKYARGWFSRV